MRTEGCHGIVWVRIFWNGFIASNLDELDL